MEEMPRDETSKSPLGPALVVIQQKKLKEKNLL